LHSAKGVVHVGANTGQERDLYDGFHLDVIWIEPIPSVFADLVANISGFPRQRAYRYLVTDEDGREYTFHVSNNGGQSSSVLGLAMHKQMHPHVWYSDSIKLESITLSSLVKKERIDVRAYEVLILDAQGSELLVLKGGAGILPHFRFIQTEVADFEAYSGCCQLPELSNFLGSHGFREYRRDIQRSTPGIGTYYEIVYKRAWRPFTRTAARRSD
jgi:FkbM family methyltransferase